MYQTQNKLDTVSLLSALAGILGERTMPHPFIVNPGYTRITGAMPAKERRDLISNSSIIEFADWAAIHDGTGLWDSVYTDVIKPLKKRDFHFLFHLGDVANKMVYDIDEVLDIMGDYSGYGKVTLMLDNNEAGNLWSKLNGAEQKGSTECGSSRANEECRFLYNTMSIDAMVVLYSHSVVEFRQEGRFVLPGIPPPNNTYATNNKTRFNTGYLMGLLLQLEPCQSMALGLAISGRAAEYPAGLDAPQLISYIHDWISIL